MDYVHDSAFKGMLLFSLTFCANLFLPCTVGCACSVCSGDVGEGVGNMSVCVLLFTGISDRYFLRY